MADLVNQRCSIYDTCAVDELRQKLRFDPGDLRKMRTALFKHWLMPKDAILKLPEGVRHAFAEQVDFQPLELDKRFDSSVDGATKLIFRTQSDFAIESVILRAKTGRVALCVSSQIGCAAACDFCATGRMGMAHNLSAAEILDQLTQANRILLEEDQSVRNIVFMGMGEPFHNEEVIHKVIESLQSSSGFHHPASRILVSTVGIPEAMLRLAKRFPSVNIALSLHSSNQSTRESIIPLAKRYPLEELRDTIEKLNAMQPERTSVMLEHLMLAGINDSDADAQSLIEWTEGLRVHLNLIPYNLVQEAPHLIGSSRQQIEHFGAKLKSAGRPTTIRYSMGHDIDAACGQLVRKENREVAARQAQEKKF